VKVCSRNDDRTTAALVAAIGTGGGAVGSAVCAAVGLGVGLAAAVCCLQKQPCALEPLALAVSLASHLPRAPWGYGVMGVTDAMVPWCHGL
jgi:hypothetical protein